MIISYLHFDKNRLFFTIQGHFLPKNLNIHVKEKCCTA